jgi:hypothetical protein
MAPIILTLNEVYENPAHTQPADPSGTTGRPTTGACIPTTDSSLA